MSLFLLLQSFCLVLFDHVKRFCLNLPLFIAQSKPHFNVFITMSTLYPLTCGRGHGVPEVWCPFRPVLAVCVTLRQLCVCVCVFRIVHTTLLVTSVMFVRRGMQGKPQREHGQTVNQTDLFQGASVTAEGVFGLTVLMVNSVFARLVPCPYVCCKNVCSRITGDIVKYKCNSGIKYSFVMYSFLHSCNCQLCPLCSVIKHHHLN